MQTLKQVSLTFKIISREFITMVVWCVSTWEEVNKQMKLYLIKVELHLNRNWAFTKDLQHSHQLFYQKKSPQNIRTWLCWRKTNKKTSMSSTLATALTPPYWFQGHDNLSILNIHLLTSYISNDDHLHKQRIKQLISGTSCNVTRSGMIKHKTRHMGKTNMHTHTKLTAFFF